MDLALFESATDVSENKDMDKSEKLYKAEKSS